MHKNPLLAVRMVMLVLFFYMSRPLLNLFGFDAQIIPARLMRCRGEVALSVGIFHLHGGEKS